MNTILLMGRLTADPEIRATQEGIQIARYTLAVDRQAAKQEKRTDFIPCVAFAKKAEFAEKHLKKGTKIAVEGRLQSEQYTDKEGKKRTSYTVVVEAHYFCDSKKQDEQKPEENAFMQVPLDDPGLPWN